ncbi:MAG: ParB/RepB/Spo0J family partition protein [Geminicoccaceae bacterium]|nr:ParB/RepB/Spo0J family partition protein [Geminicoccaceae bacterium]
MPERKRPKDLRAGLADIYAGRSVPPAGGGETAERAESAPAAADASRPHRLGRVGGAPAVLVEQQRQGLLQENAELRAALEEMRSQGQVTVELDPERVLDRYPADRVPQAFADSAFDSLVQSIDENGQDQPIMVRPHPSREDCFEIAYGRRRREACRRLGRKVRAVVRQLDDEELLRLMIRENEEREDLSLYERARFMRALGQAEHLSVRQMGKRMGLSPGYVSRLLRLPELPEPLIAIIGDPRPLSMRTLEALAAALDGDVERCVERITERWGKIRPASSADARARQVIKLAQPHIPAERSEKRQLRMADGRVIGQFRRDRHGRYSIDLAADLEPAEIESIVEAVRRAIDTAPST